MQGLEWGKICTSEMLKIPLIANVKGFVCKDCDCDIQSQIWSRPKINWNVCVCSGNFSSLSVADQCLWASWRISCSVHQAFYIETRSVIRFLLLSSLCPWSLLPLPGPGFIFHLCLHLRNGSRFYLPAARMASGNGMSSKHEGIFYFHTHLS